jgi:hypothetical protein
MYTKNDIIFITSLVIAIFAMSYFFGRYYPAGYYLVGVITTIAVPVYYMVKEIKKKK